MDSNIGFRNEITMARCTKQHTNEQNYYVSVSENYGWVF